MNYISYSTEDFIQDEFFQHWVFAPNDETNQYWNSFSLQYPMQQKTVEEAREFLLAMKLERAVPESIVQRIKVNFNTAIDRLEADQKQFRDVAEIPRKQARKSVFLRALYPVAASLFLVAILAGYFIIQKDGAHNLLQALTLAKEKTPKGKQQHVVLEDGTHVWLNSNSELKYERSFSGKMIREVYLEGEAFFDVSENREKPFMVHASGLDIKVLGTAFNVRSYAGEHVVETTLVRGKISLASEGVDSVHQVTLLPNQQALFSKDSRTIALEEAVNTENYISWKNGWMIFDDKPFSYIKETLERGYNVTIVMGDENSLTCTFSARFKDKTLQEVLEIFKTTESIDYRIAGDRVFIYGRLCEYGNSN